MTELDKLQEYLVAKGFRFERTDTPAPEELKVVYGDRWKEGIGERHQIVVYGKDEHIAWDAICHWGSYGWEKGLLEIMGTIVRPDAGDEVEGWLTAQDIIKRLEAIE